MADSLDTKKKELELRKLEAEIDNLSKPTWKKPSIWISAVTAVVALFAMYDQLTISQQKTVEAELKFARAELEEIIVRGRVDSIKIAYKALDNNLDSLSAIFSDLELAYRKLSPESDNENAIFDLLISVSKKVCGFEKLWEETDEFEFFQELYQTPSGYYFVHTESSMDSDYGGATINEWVNTNSAMLFQEQHCN